MSRGSSHRVAAVVASGANPFELAVATEIFGLPRPELPVPWYELVVCAPSPSLRLNAGLLTLAELPGLAAAEEAETLILPNQPDPLSPPDPEVVGVVRRAAARGARLVSFCTGAFTLAAAGVLDGRRATTHWVWAGELAARYPLIDVQPDVLFVNDGNVFTAAGSAAALDLGLHLVRLDHGADIANAVGRRLVFAAHRDGGQRQFIERPVPRVPDESLACLLDWARQRLDRPLAVGDLARHAAVSPATLHRRFQAELGTIPLAWLTAERVALAAQLIERGERRLERVARASGLGTASNLRVQLRRRTGLTPTAYRERFGTQAEPFEANQARPLDVGAGAPQHEASHLY